MRFRAAVLHGFREEFSIEYIEAEPPQGWVMLKVGATGICGRDIVVWRGGFRNLKPPLVLGHEVYGSVNGKPYGVYPAIDSTLLLGESVQGGYAEYVPVPMDSLVELPTRDYERYAASVCGVATMIHASRVAGVSSGDRVLVTGSLGGVGIHGIQYLVVNGLEVYAYSRRREYFSILEELGAIPVATLDFYRESGRVDAVFEIVGSPTINKSMLTLRRGGVLVLVGNVTGEPVVIERPAVLVMRELRIMGTAAYTVEEYKQAISIVSSGRIKPFYKAYKLEDVNEAYKDLQEGRVIGRAVLKP
ncbi:MAG: zinc-binding dehydrogenase [Desulfurococcales archaeon]|nr:zinc-binding dehydrogenase [Desulfurococcales archaeon]